MLFKHSSLVSGWLLARVLIVVESVSFDSFAKVLYPEAIASRASISISKEEYLVSFKNMKWGFEYGIDTFKGKDYNLLRRNFGHIFRRICWN